MGRGERVALPNGVGKGSRMILRLRRVSGATDGINILLNLEGFLAEGVNILLLVGPLRVLH